MPDTFLALDLGAESGRGMLVRLDGGRVTLEEIHRFPNRPVELLGTLYWDLPFLFAEVKQAIALAAQATRQRGERLASVGIDAWGVDCALLDRNGRLLANPVHYRDARTDAIMERVFARVPRERIFAATGLLFMQFNTLFQLAAELESDPRRFDAVGRVLFIPDLFHYLLTGVVRTEPTIASTSQMWDPRSGAWCESLVEEIGIPARVLPEVGPSGSVVGPLLESIARETGLDRPVPVIAGACHDTGAAVAAVPATGSAVESGAGERDGDPPVTWGFLSSGTWSLMGIELDTPLINDDVLESNFTNEAGIDGRVRFLRIIMGLWLVQECRRHWEGEGRSYDYDELETIALEAAPLRSIVWPDDPVFFRAGEMPDRIATFCRETGQPVPETHGAMVRCALESLALAYADCAHRIAALTGKRIGRLHIVGGGSRNRLLDQLTADALGVEVVAGPTEATALGNGLMQAVAMGALDSLEALREAVAASTPTERFEPARERAESWCRAAGLFNELRARRRQ